MDIYVAIFLSFRSFKLLIITIICASVRRSSKFTLRISAGFVYSFSPTYSQSSSSLWAYEVVILQVSTLLLT